MADQAALIPALPLAGFVILLFFGRRLGEALSGWLATAMVTASFAVTALVFADLLSHPEEERQLVDRLFTWMSVGALEVDVAFLLDPLSVTMALFVTGVSALIHLYSIGYMHGDERYSRFFAYLNLFVFSMLMLVLADNFLLMFLGWEGVGACSYLLISFWFERPSAASAGKKAFVTNRIGDFGFLLAMFLMFGALGSLQYFGAEGVLSEAEQLPEVTATAIVLLLFVGAVGKSAQLPLYVWLPDAMEGPTPVSALIHAATMVTAGVYLMARSAPLIDVGSDMAPLVIAIIGAATALFAATIACAQNDIKRVLAYSTVSQLGYMFLAIGSGAYVAAIFHMVTHAFFKALLFLGAGSVIHGMHNEQDMKRMGALRALLPITAFTFIIGWLAIAGVPPFAGFWSKDEILIAAYDKNVILYGVGLVTALLTAYYMTRQVVLVFFGNARWKESASHAAAPESPSAHEGPERQHGEPHESPWVMWLPLVVLAGLAGVAGALNAPMEPIRLKLEHWLHPVVGEYMVEHHYESGTKWILAGFATSAAAIGIVLGFKAWSRTAHRPGLEPGVLQNAWWVDRLYAATIEAPGRVLANWSAYVVDRRVIDGAVNGVGTLVSGSASGLRRLQTGYVRNYALGIAFGTAMLLGLMVLRGSI